MSKHTQIMLCGLVMWFVHLFVMKHVSLVPVPGLVYAAFADGMFIAYVIVCEFFLRDSN